MVAVHNGRATILGSGQLVGIPEELFSGNIRYRTPSTPTGWVLILQRSIETVGATIKGEVLGGDAIPVRFLTGRTSPG